MNSPAESTARSVFLAEVQAIQDLSDQIPDDLDHVVRLIAERPGKVVVSGVGKSGHIGKKIAATLSSVGTSAFFIHPTEASHGDLGMIQPQDTCLLISNSGETAELSNLIEHCKRFSIPLIAMSTGQDSTLMTAADLKLSLPAVSEGCPIKLAPMASSIITLAMGDALAACLMVEKGFQATDFALLHPGGKLGAQLARVARLMHTGDRLPLVAHDVPMKEALVTITEKGFGTAGVMKDGKLVGVITDGDVRRNIDGLFERTASEIMTREPITISENALSAEALAAMEEHSISALFVTGPDNVALGLLHMHDLLRWGAK